MSPKRAKLMKKVTKIVHEKSQKGEIKGCLARTPTFISHNESDLVHFKSSGSNSYSMSDDFEGTVKNGLTP